MSSIRLPHCVHAAAVAVAFGHASLALASSTAIAPATAAMTPATAATAAASDEPFALRVVSEPGERISLEIAIRDYRPVDGDGPTIALVGVAHIGDAAYYAQLQEYLDDSDLVLYESVAPTGASGARGDTGRERQATTRNAARFIGRLAASQASATGAWPSDPEALSFWVGGRDARLGHFATRAAIDAWGRSLVVLPAAGVDADSGDDMRVVASWGRDGEPGGNGEDADVMVVVGRDQGLGGLGADERGEEDNLQASLASALGLAYQLDTVDYDRPHFVPSDMAIDEVNSAMTERGADFSLVEGTLAGSSLPARVVKMMLNIVGMADRFTGGAASVAMKVMFVEMLGDESVFDSGMQQLDPAFGEVIIDVRNQRVIDDLAAVLTRGPERLETIAVFYGAGHLVDLGERMEDQLGYEATGDVQWLPAISIDLKSSPVSERQLRQIRMMVKRSMRQMQMAQPNDG
ncbi:MAG: hypothetical protein AB8G96_17540 [Phycisphaerales bacterium]